jgi:hypothetical protein
MVDLIYQKIENIIEYGEAGFDPPEKLDDLNLSLTLFVQAYQKGKLDGMPEEILNLLEQYIQQIQALMAPPKPQAPIGSEMASGAQRQATPTPPMDQPQDASNGQQMPPGMPGPETIQ